MLYPDCELVIQCLLTLSFWNRNHNHSLTCQTICTVKHILIECRTFAVTRKWFFKVNNLTDLFKNVKIDDILSFLRETELYQLVIHGLLTLSFWNRNHNHSLTCQTTCTVKHILIECKTFAVTRKRFFKVNNLTDLFENVKIDNILSFLRETELYQKIWQLKTG